MYALRFPTPQLFSAWTSAVVLFATSAGCKSSVQVQHEYAEDLYHRGYQTYGLLEHPVGRSAEVDRLIETSIHDEMAAKGYTRQEPADAQLLVSYKVLLHGEVAPVGPLEDADLAGTWFTDGVPEGERSVQAGVGKTAEQWPEPGPNAVWVAAPPVEGSRLQRDAQDKTVLVLMQEAESFHVVWLGWSLAEVSQADLVATTEQAIGEIMARVPEARR